MHKTFLVTAIALGGLAVAFGAFGAHALKKIVPESAVNTFETGVRYQFYHVFVLLMIGMLFDKVGSKYLVWAGNSFITGIIMFSGSLYLITLLTALGKQTPTLVGIITPLGGVALILGWMFLLLGIIKG